MSDLETGSIVVIQGHTAVVRYKGSIDGQTGVWVGVEWDDPTRGKHDGCTGGKRYFSCEAAVPTAGSFVRIERVPLGRSIVDALTARYTNQVAEYGMEGAGDEQYVNTVRQRRVQVELVGAAKISRRQANLENLEAARLVGMGVDRLGDASGLAATVPNLAVLDLSCNLFAGLPRTWQFIRGLATALPALEVVNLSDNRIVTASQSPQPPQQQDQTRPALLPSDSSEEKPSLTVGEGESQPSAVKDALVSSPAPPAATQEAPTPPGAVNLLHAPGLPPLEGLRALVLNRTGVSWTQMLGLAPSLPALAELHLDGNRMTTLTPWTDPAGGSPFPSGLFPALEVLTLESNRLKSWSEVSAEVDRQAPNLKRLHLGENPIDEIRIQTRAAAGETGTVQTTNGAPRSTSDGDEDGSTAAAATAVAATSGPLGHLECLLLGNCQLRSWTDVDSLATLPSLKELRLSGNPLLAQAPSGGRFQVIARVPQLVSLNAADVREREHRDSELRYLQTIGAEMEEALREVKRRLAAEKNEGDDAAAAAAVAAASKASIAEVFSRHPRAAELQALHGPIVMSQSGSGSGRAGGSSLSSSLVELKLTCVSTSASAKMGSQVKRLPRGMTVGALKALCEKLFKVRSNKQLIFLRNPESPVPETVPESEEESSLAYLGVQDNSEILVDEAA